MEQKLHPVQGFFLLVNAPNRTQHAALKEVTTLVGEWRQKVGTNVHADVYPERVNAAPNQPDLRFLTVVIRAHVKPNLARSVEDLSVVIAQRLRGFVRTHHTIMQIPDQQQLRNAETEYRRVEL